MTEHSDQMSLGQECLFGLQVTVYDRWKPRQEQEGETIKEQCLLGCFHLIHHTSVTNQENAHIQD